MRSNGKLFFPFGNYLRFTLTLLVLWGTGIYGYNTLPPYWSVYIDSALTVRDSFFTKALPDSNNFSIVLYNDDQQNTLCEKLRLTTDTLNPWYCFVTGMIDCGKKKQDPDKMFMKALSLAQDDPGTTWALFVEFTRNKQHAWAEKFLTLLKKQLLISGGTSSQVIAQQLLHYGLYSVKQQDLAAANKYYEWAKLFDPGAVWASLLQAPHSFASNLLQSLFHILDAAQTVGSTWSVQLSIVASLYHWFRVFLILSILIIFLIVALKYIPIASHSITDRLPQSIPRDIRTVMPVIVILSCLWFGLIPFLWVIAFFLWGYLIKSDKYLLGCALLCVTLSPLDARIREMFIESRSPQNPISLYNRATIEGYSSDLQRFILEKNPPYRQDFLLQMAAGLCAMKAFDTATGILYMEKAVALRPRDPVVLVNSGNSAYFANNFKSAALNYQQVLNTQPENHQARFNLAQCFARNSDTATDLDFVKMLSKKGQVSVTDFLNTNKLYFSGNEPLLRQVMFPSYDPIYFWLNVFPRYNGSWKSSSGVWSRSFFGFPPLISLVFFVLLFAMVLIGGLTESSRSRQRAIQSCRLCGCFICKKCKKGELCARCAAETQFIRNVKTLAKIQTTIIQRHTKRVVIREQILDMVFPGSGMLYMKRYSLFKILPVIFATSMLYATILAGTTVDLWYPFWVVEGIQNKIPYVIAAYLLFFVIRALVVLLRKREVTIA